MARPLSEGKRNAILVSAAKIIAEQGIGAPTSRIAKEASVAEGTIFKYFATKEQLYNQLYIKLKAELTQKLLSEYPSEADIRKRTWHIWIAYVTWAVLNRDKRKAMQQLGVSTYISIETHNAINKILSDVTSLLQSLVNAERGLSLEFIAAMMASLAETTVDFMLSNPEKADECAEVGFNAFWRAVISR